MVWKLFVTALVLGLAWLLLFRRPGPGPAAEHARARRVRDALTLKRCPDCGRFRTAERPCDCTSLGDMR